jgi:hypothetical protein
VHSRSARRLAAAAAMAVAGIAAAAVPAGASVSPSVSDTTPVAVVAAPKATPSPQGVVGGTSASSPIIASVYAPAGTPATGSYPPQWALP